MKTKAILLMVFFLGWVTTGWAADHVKGDGKLTSKKISVAEYNEINNRFQRSEGRSFHEVYRKDEF